MANIFQTIFGSRDKLKKVPTMAPYQQRAFQSFFDNPIQQSPLYNAGSSYLQNILSGDPNAFAAFEAPYLQNFEQNIVPGIAERFAGMGTGAGALNSSGLNNSLAQAGRNLQTDLAGLRAGLQMQALPQALGYAQQPYSNILAGSQVSPFAYAHQPGSPGLLGGVLGGFGQGAGQAFGLGTGGPMFNYFSSLWNSPYNNIGMQPSAYGYR